MSGIDEGVLDKLRGEACILLYQYTYNDLEDKMKHALSTVIIFVFCFSHIALAIEKKSIEDIPPDLPPGVLDNVENLFSKNPVTRAQSAKSVSNYYDKRAIPFLYSIIDDSSSLKWSSNPLNAGVLMVGDIRTTPGIEALISIWKIGNEKEFESTVHWFAGPRHSGWMRRTGSRTCGSGRS